MARGAKVHPAVGISHRPRVAAFPCGALLVVSTWPELRPGPTALVAAIALGWPWLLRWLSIRSRDSGRAAYRGMLCDALLVGVFAGLTSFQPVPTVVLVLVIATLNMTMGGVRFFLQTLAMTLAGALLSLTFATPDFTAPARPATLIWSVLLVTIACWYTAYLVNDTTKRFIETRRDLRLRNEELEQLNRIARMVNATLDPDEVMKAAMSALQRLFSFDQFGIFTIDPVRGVLVVDRQLGTGFRPDLTADLNALEVPLNDEGSMFASVVRTRQRVFIHHFTFAQVAALSPSDARLYELSPVKGLMLFPLEIHGDVHGVIAFGNTRAPFELDETMLDVIGRYVTQIVTAIHNARLFDAAEKARAAALDADRAKSSFLANISQELRRPLNAIVGHTDLLRVGESDDDVPVADRLERIRESGQRLRALVDDVLEISRLEAGQRSLSTTEVPVRALAEEAVSAALPIAVRSHADVRIDVAPDAGSIQTDRPIARRVLGGVLSTALDATDDGTVRLQISREQKDGEERFRFAVVVESSNLTRDATSRLFDDFRAGSAATGDRQSASGLAVARRFCRFMGGDLTVRGQAGRGAMFTVELPSRVVTAPVPREVRSTAAAADGEDEAEEEEVGGVLLPRGSHYSDEELLSRLQTNELAGVLGASGLTALAATIEVRRCAAGEVIVDQGGRAEQMFLLLEGRARIVARFGGTSFELLEEVESGAVFGEIAFIAGGRRPARIVAVEDCWIGCLRQSDVDRLVEEDPGLAIRLSQVATRRLLAAHLPEHLRSVFGDLEHDVLLRLIGESDRVVLRSGETLFRQGDAADAVFIVLNGRLQVEVTREGVVYGVAEVGRGESVGEMALVTGEERSASVVALRDSELARLPRSSFERLMEEYPRSAFALTRLLAHRLQRAASSDRRAVTRPTTFALVAVTPDVPLEECARHLEAALAEFGTVARIDPLLAASALGRRDIGYVDDHDPGHVRLTQWFAEMELSQQFLIYQADSNWTSWTERAVRQADRILIVARSDRDPATGEVEQRIRLSWKDDRTPRADLLMLHPAGTEEPRGTLRWLEQRNVERHFHARRGSAADFARLARIVTGNALGMVLGGGGARAFAHIGVIRALEQLSIPIDLIGGTSFGAAVSASYAIGNDSAGLAKMAQDNFSQSFIDLTFPAYALLRGSGIMEICDRAFGDRTIEDLWMPFFCISTNLSQADVVVHRRGSLSRSVRSSLAIPGVVPAVVEGEDLLVDGGLLNNVPVDVMRSLVGSGRVLAVDVSSGSRLRADVDPGLEVSGWRLLFDRVRPGRRRRLPTIGGILNRVTIVESTRSRTRLMQQADAYVTLPLRGYGMMDFLEFAPLMELGYEGSIEPLREWVSASSA